MKYKVRKDANHAEIVAALEACGVLVTDLYQVGGGVPDLLCFWRGRTVLLEVKTPTGKLNKLQQNWHAARKDCAVYVVTSAEEAIDAVMGAA